MKKKFKRSSWVFDYPQGKMRKKEAQERLDYLNLINPIRYKFQSLKN